MILLIVLSVEFVLGVIGLNDSIKELQDGKKK